MTLVAVYDSTGCRGRCDAKCYSAKGKVCHCICGGKNHGRGQQKAVENTRDMAEIWIKRWEDQHPTTPIVQHRISDATLQQDLFDMTPYTDAFQQELRERIMEDPNERKGA